jgi:hypothetical protein
MGGAFLFIYLSPLTPNALAMVVYMLKMFMNSIKEKKVKNRKDIIRFLCFEKEIVCVNPVISPECEAFNIGRIRQNAAITVDVGKIVDMKLNPLLYE